ncbi:hypothetical protein CS371_17480 (plasmid) [Serratia marcescens]|uniref:hypothetical protein n=1 Tax=Serratia marcescens TaxID=615 RepID=UPI000C1369A7|nr:hypothetical protein [Serratia marcescens]PHY81349.1 hypothetical protein CS371_17480 [Serratia marcescens]
MSQRYNTGNPRPSNSMKDLNDNALAYDDFLNSDDDEALDRFQRPFPTVRKQVAERIDEITGAQKSIEQYTDEAKQAADNAQNIADANTYYTSPSDPDGTIAGIAGTPDGKMFRVAIQDGAGVTVSFNYYKNDAGTAIFINSDPSKRFVDATNETANLAMAGADESNALTIGGIMAHDCSEKAWMVVGSKLRLLRVHEELTIVTTSPSSPKAFEVRTGYGRVNSYFSSVGGGIGNVSVDIVPTNPLEHIHAFGAVDTSSDTLGSPRGTIVLMSGDPAPLGGSNGVVYAKNLKIVASARCTVNRVEVLGDFTGEDPTSSINGGNFTNVIYNVCKIYNCLFRNAFTIQPLLTTTYTNCTFNGEPHFVGERAYVNGGFIQSGITVDNNYRADFSQTRIQSINITGTNVDVSFLDVIVLGNYTLSSSATGVWLLNNVRIDGTKSAWRLPTSAPWVGARTQNPDPRANEGVDFTFTAGGWSQLTTRGT